LLFNVGFATSYASSQGVHKIADVVRACQQPFYPYTKVA